MNAQLLGVLALQLIDLLAEQDVLLLDVGEDERDMRLVVRVGEHTLCHLCHAREAKQRRYVSGVGLWGEERGGVDVRAASCRVRKGSAVFTCSIGVIPEPPAMRPIEANSF